MIGDRMLRTYGGLAFVRFLFVLFSPPSPPLTIETKRTKNRKKEPNHGSDPSSMETRSRYDASTNEYG